MYNVDKTAPNFFEDIDLTLKVDTVFDNKNDRI
jgi:hypothetical protein